MRVERTTDSTIYGVLKGMAVAATWNPGINNPSHVYARWGEPLLFGFPNDSARQYVQQEGLVVLSDSQGPEYMCIAEVPNKSD